MRGLAFILSCGWLACVTATPQRSDDALDHDEGSHPIGVHSVAEGCSFTKEATSRGCILMYDVALDGGMHVDEAGREFRRVVDAQLRRDMPCGSTATVCGLSILCECED